MHAARAFLIGVLTLSSTAPGGWALDAQQAGSPVPAVGLDFEFFKTRVQPIFVAKRPGHARCISCHVEGTPMRLQPLTPGTSTWSDEASRKNFDVVVQRSVVPGSPQSRLLVHTLAEAAGGDFYHNGGKHWKSQNDPEWQTLKAWVMGQTARSGAK